MKILLSIICITLLTIGAAAQNKKTMNSTNSPQVVVYFSATGTTEAVAKQIAAEAGAELLAITPAQTYTSADLDWRYSKSRSSVEMNDDKSRPAIKAIKDLSKYNTIYLGYPIWWDLAPRVVNTFIEAAKLEGKTVIPFATSGSSSITNSVRVLKQTYPNIKWQDGKLMNRATKADIKAFVKK